MVQSVMIFTFPGPIYIACLSFCRMEVWTNIIFISFSRSFKLLLINTTQKLQIMQFTDFKKKGALASEGKSISG